MTLVPVPHPIEQFLLVDEPPGAVDERLEQREEPRRGLHRLAGSSTGGFPRGRARTRRTRSAVPSTPFLLNRIADIFGGLWRNFAALAGQAFSILHNLGSARRSFPTASVVGLDVQSSRWPDRGVAHIMQSRILRRRSLMTMACTALVAVTYGGATGSSARILRTETTLPVTTAAVHESAGDLLARLPLAFERNDGQFDAGVRFSARGDAYEVALGAARRPARARRARRGARAEIGVTLRGRRPAREHARRARRSRAATTTTAARIPPAWTGDVPSFERVRATGIYQGIDVEYYGRDRQLEYDFLVAPGADASQIVAGVRRRRPGEHRRDRRPAPPRRHADDPPAPPGGVPGHADRAGAASRPTTCSLGSRRVVIALGDYDHDLPLVIDPVLAYSSYFGGNADDGVRAIAVDANGNIYLTGVTQSTNFPRANAAQNAKAGDATHDRRLRHQAQSGRDDGVLLDLPRRLRRRERGGRDRRLDRGRRQRQRLRRGGHGVERLSDDQRRLPADVRRRHEQPGRRLRRQILGDRRAGLLELSGRHGRRPHQRGRHRVGRRHHRQRPHALDRARELPAGQRARHHAQRQRRRLRRAHRGQRRGARLLDLHRRHRRRALVLSQRPRDRRPGQRLHLGRHLVGRLSDHGGRDPHRAHERHHRRLRHQAERRRPDDPRVDLVRRHERREPRERRGPRPHGRGRDRRRDQHRRPASRSSTPTRRPSRAASATASWPS